MHHLRKGVRAWWRDGALFAPMLGFVCKELLAVCPTEASVERVFRHQGALHTESRNRLAHDTVVSQLGLRLNPNGWWM